MIYFSTFFVTLNKKNNTIKINRNNLSKIDIVKNAVDSVGKVFLIHFEYNVIVTARDMIRSRHNIFPR